MPTYCEHPYPKVSGSIPPVAADCFCLYTFLYSCSTWGTSLSWLKRLGGRFMSIVDGHLLTSSSVATYMQAA